MSTMYEFFAGGGMALAGMGKGWSCSFANDFDAMKGSTYARNWGDDHLHVADVNTIGLADLPGHVDLAWASFPCQDLSLAGNYAGIGSKEAEEHTRSGAFWAFWNKMQGLVEECRAPSLIVLENVFGVLTSNSGKDFAAIAETLALGGYNFGAVVVDAKLFVPQSRVRVFFVAVKDTSVIPNHIMGFAPSDPWHPSALIRAYEGMSKDAKDKWIWWSMALPSQLRTRLEDIIEDHPSDVAWHTKQETDRVIELMNRTNREKVEKAKFAGHRMVGSIYRRTRPDGEDGAKQQRAEVRFDGIAGCLRTPSGGSSRQMIMVVDGKKVRTRLLSAREAARLMGLPDSYILPERYNDAYHVCGDGVVVPVVAHLREQLFDEVVQSNARKKKAA